LSANPVPRISQASEMVRAVSSRRAALLAFGMIVYLIIYGFFDRTGANVTLSLLMMLKLAFAARVPDSGSSKVYPKQGPRADHPDVAGSKHHRQLLARHSASSAGEHH
jgi:hypothetical protein